MRDKERAGKRLRARQKGYLVHGLERMSGTYYFGQGNFKFWSAKELVNSAEPCRVVPITYWEAIARNQDADFLNETLNLRLGG